MALWDERIGSSRAWQAVEASRARLSDLAQDFDPDEALGRASRLVEIAAERLRMLDPDLAVQSELESLGQRIDGMTDAVSNLLAPAEGQSSPSIASVTKAADQAAEIIGSLPDAGSEEAVAIADIFRRELGGVEAKVTEVVEQAEAAVAASTEEHTRVLNERKGEAANLGQRLNQLQSSVEVLRTTVEEFINDRTTATETAANEAKAAHDAQRERARKDAEKLLTATTQSFEQEANRQREAHEELAESLTSRATEHLSEIERMKKRVEDLVGAVGRTGLSGGFQQWEESERVEADRMRRYAIWFGAAAAVAVIALVVVRMFVGDVNDNQEWGLTIGALSIPAALGAVAVYLGKESARHRRNQIIARRTELELASFGPYLADLDKAEQAELTALFAPVFFGQAMVHMSGKKDDDHAGPEPLLKQLLDKLAEIVKQRRTQPPD